MLNKKSRGNIVVPVLFVVTAFAILMTSGRMFNTSITNPDEKFDNPTTSSDPKKQNLQLKKLTFQPRPTPVTDTCNHDMSKKADLATCKCTAWLVKCESGACVDVDESKSGIPGTKEEVCKQFDQNNWCQIFSKEGDGWYCIGKPVIYLYPEIPMLVDVKVITKGNVVVSDPKIETGGKWTNVLAHPNGILFYKNFAYRELFYETESRTLNQPKSGFVVKSTNLEKELLSFIERLGLIREDEKDEFLDWWLPRLEAYDSPYWFVSILEKEEKERVDKVEILPKPDTFIEFIAYFRPLEKEVKVQELTLPPTPRRIGFTAVEWGGVIEE